MTYGNQPCFYYWHIVKVPLPGLHALALCQAKKINFAIKRVIILLAYLDLAKNKLYFAMELTYK